jgi:protein SCO1
MQKNKSYIWISFVVLVFGIVVVPEIVERIKNGTIVKNDRLASEKNSVSESKQLLPIGPAPKFILANQNKEIITNDSFKNKVYLVEFFFTSCPSICPIMNKNMKIIATEFNKNSNFGIASITIDPEKDTPEVLKKHADLLGVENKNWHFLSGKKETIMNLANAEFKLYAAKNPKIQGGFEHSGLFALVDKKGNIRSRKDEFGNPIVYYDGLENKQIELLKNDITILLNE